MHHSKHARLTAIELAASVRDGATMYGPSDEKIGWVSYSHGVGPNAVVVVDVSGFLGIGAKTVSVPLSELAFVRGDDGNVHAVTPWTKDELKAMADA